MKEHRSDVLRAKSIVEKLWGSKSSIGLNENERSLLECLVHGYLLYNKFIPEIIFAYQEASLKRLTDKNIVKVTPFGEGKTRAEVALTDIEEQEVENAVDVEGMGKGGQVKEWITANSDKVAYPKLRTPDKKIWTLHSSCKTREEAEAKRDSLRDGFYDDAKILDIYDGTNQKIYVYVTDEKETGKEPLCKITVIENGKRVVLNCFTEEEKKETFEEIKMRKLPIIDVSSKMESGGSAKAGKKDDTEIKIFLDDVTGISSGMLHKKGEYDSYSVKRLMHHLEDNEFYSKLVGEDMYLITANRVYLVPSVSQEAYSLLRVNFPYDTPIGKAGTSTVPSSDKYGTGAMAKGGKVGFWDRFFGKKEIEPIHYIDKSELELNDKYREVIADQKKRDGYSDIEVLEFLKQSKIHSDHFSSAERQKEIVHEVAQKLGVPEKYEWHIYNHTAGYFNTPYEMKEDGTIGRYRAGYGKGGDVMTDEEVVISLIYKDKDGIDWAKDRLLEDKVKEAFEGAGIKCGSDKCELGTGISLVDGERDIAFIVKASEGGKAKDAIKETLKALDIPASEVKVKMSKGGAVKKSSSVEINWLITG